jgi:aerobic carbon-monoxide dehydrogenase large subunit
MARLGAVDLLRVRARPGVVAAYAADDLGGYWKPGPLLVPPPPIEGTIFNQRTQVPLARGKVRHAGEPVAAGGDRPRAGAGARFSAGP